MIRIIQESTRFPIVITEDKKVWRKPFCSDIGRNYPWKEIKPKMHQGFMKINYQDRKYKSEDLKLKNVEYYENIPFYNNDYMPF